MNPKLIYSDTKKEVKLGDRINLRADEDNQFEWVTVCDFREPHKPASSGKVVVKHATGATREYYVGVIGAEWINRRDR